MFGKQFHLNEETMAVVEEIGQHMPGGFFIYKAEAPGELLFANNALFEIFGCDDLDDFMKLTGYTFEGMVHPEDYAAVSETINKQIREKKDKTDYAEYRIIRKDGNIHWVDDYGHYTETDKYGGIYYVFISDITEKRERMESHLAMHHATIRDLSESNEKLASERITFSRVAQALAGDYFSIYIVDPQTEHFVEYSSIPDYDQLNIQKTGKDFFAVSRKNMERLIYPEDRDRFMAVFTKERVLSIIERDGHFITKYRLMFGGVPVYLSLKALILEDEDGRHMIIGINNIDAQIKREEEFRRKVADARNRAKNDFLANMSHDIRTPMNAIVGYTNIARERQDDPEMVADALEKIGSASHFLLSLINDILDISKIESGKMQLNEGDCDLEKIFRRIKDITSLQAQSKALVISYDHSRVKHFKVRADVLRIEQVLVNIVTNAIKYTPDGGKVDLAAEEESLPEEGRERYRFVVKDTGVGISEEYLPHIFESFTREENTTVNRIQGTGLGLAITARVVEMMGGSIRVESKPGEGSKFTVELDLQTLEETVQETKSDRVISAENLAGTRILLVEDNDINAEIAMMVLTQYQAQAERACNGQEGADKVRKNGEGYYDAVLMDIQMPGMNGYEATRAIRSEKGAYYSELPIIAMSANAYDEDVRECLEAGMNAHIAKPFDPGKLLEILHRHIHTGDRQEEGPGAG